MRVARRRVGVLAEDHGLDALERRQAKAVEDVRRRREQRSTGGDAGVEPRRHIVRRTFGEERQPAPAFGLRARAEGRESPRDGSRHLMTMRPSTFASTVGPFLRT